MRIVGASTATVAVLAATVVATPVRAGTYEGRSPLARAGYTTVAMIANVVPVVSAIFAPKCLPGYVVCKLTFAGMSLIAAADQLAVSGGSDMPQTRAILHRGFAGDWFLTGRHVAGETQPQPLPDPPPPASAGGWEPPPR